LTALQGDTLVNSTDIQKMRSLLVFIDEALNDYIVTNDHVLQESNNKLESQISDLQNQLNAQKSQSLSDMKSAASMNQARYDDLHGSYVMVRNCLFITAGILVVCVVILVIVLRRKFRSIERRLS
jgi:hypothetical protein